MLTSFVSLVFLSTRPCWSQTWQIPNEEPWNDVFWPRPAFRPRFSWFPCGDLQWGSCFFITAWWRWLRTTIVKQHAGFPGNFPHSSMFWATARMRLWGMPLKFTYINIKTQGTTRLPNPSAFLAPKNIMIVIFYVMRRSQKNSSGGFFFAGLLLQPVAG